MGRGGADRAARGLLPRGAEAGAGSPRRGRLPRLPRAPGDPEDAARLRAHDCLHYTNVTRAEERRFKATARDAPVATAGSLDTNHGLALRAAVLAGVGLGVLPEFMVAAELRAGALVELLQAYALPRRTAIHALYARARPTPPKVKVFLEHLSARLRAAGVSGA